MIHFMLGDGAPLVRPDSELLQRPSTALNQRITAFRNAMEAPIVTVGAIDIADHRGAAAAD